MDQTVNPEPGLSSNLIDIFYSHKEITLDLEINAGLINIQKKKKKKKKENLWVSGPGRPGSRSRGLITFNDDSLLLNRAKHIAH